MTPFLAAEGEDVLAEIRPHPASFAMRYLADLAWLALGALAVLVHVEAGATDSTRWVGLAAFATFAVMHGVGAKLLRAPGIRFGLLVALVALALIVGVVGDWIDAMASLILLAALACFFAFVRTEFDRARRTVYVTSRRIVLRKGLARVHERAIDLEEVESVRATQGPWGQLFHYGTLVLTMKARGRAKPGHMAPAEVLAGIPDWEEVKHSLEAVLQERLLPPRERAKRAEERRVRDSMRALASWSGSAQP